MADPQVSPISQLLHTLGLTREDLNKRSDQMRQFLTADPEALSSRVSDRDTRHRSVSRSDIRSNSRSSTAATFSTRSRSRARSGSLRDASPPVTPVKTEQHESTGALRHFDSMELVIERQRQSRKERRNRRGKERGSASKVDMPHPPSPSPSSASQSSHSLDSLNQKRADVRSPAEAEGTGSAGSSAETSIPVTPQKNKYYRDHTLLSTPSDSNRLSVFKVEPATPANPSPAQATPQSAQAPPQYYGYPQYIFPSYMQMPHRSAQSGPSVPPVTPQTRRTLKKVTIQSPLPPSSPPQASSPPAGLSPFSSPQRPVNMVSSPGPMGPPPTEEEYESLPYTLPPGPYSPNKPDLSYAALVGRAILSSPEHRLTLQEIYDWITIVYPHYKRGETTWMNSIRHVLSTTVCFRKVPRERSIGRTLWAIWDEDLPCFKDGGFRKQLCKDIANASDKLGSSKTKSKVRKRPDEDDETRTNKKAKKELVALQASGSDFMQPYSLPASVTSHTLFPPTRPTTHHQPYYESCMTQPAPPLPAEIIFPPLPSAASFNEVFVSTATSSNSSAPENKEEKSSDLHSPPSDPIAPLSQSSSSLSLPGLTPNRSSSPPSSLPSTSDMDIDDTVVTGEKKDAWGFRSSVAISGMEDDLDLSSASGETEDGDDVFNTSMLVPVRFWGESPGAGALQPGIELVNFDDSDEEDNASKMDLKGKKRQEDTRPKNFSFRRAHESPSLGRRSSLSRTTPSSNDASETLFRDATRSRSPPSSIAPSTPPRKTHELPLSSVRTPISHMGLHMSPSASLAHYKSNLDPPPTVTFHVTTKLDYDEGSEPCNEDDSDLLHTPRKRTGTTSSHHPVTPKRLVFPSGSTDSPFRTPQGGGIGSSPYRTPRSRAIFDPHDPRTMLNEELNRMRDYGDSPGGLFGNARGSLLYDSPGLDSSQKWW